MVVVFNSNQTARFRLIFLHTSINILLRQNKMNEVPFDNMQNYSKSSTKRLKEKVLLSDYSLDPQQLTNRFVITRTTRWHCASFFSSDQLSQLFYFHVWFWGRIKIPVGVHHLKPVEDLPCVNNKDKDRGG